jgi:hypothetical protein
VPKWRERCVAAREKKNAVALPGPFDRLKLGRRHPSEVDASHSGTDRTEGHNSEINDGRQGGFV